MICKKCKKDINFINNVDTTIYHIFCEECGKESIKEEEIKNKLHAMSCLHVIKNDIYSDNFPLSSISKKSLLKFCELKHC